MEQRRTVQGRSGTGVARASQQAGCYVYCVAPTRAVVSLGRVGIEGREVYTVVHKDLGALVHDCPAQPYRSSEAAVVATWVLAHHQVVEAAWKRWSTVLPLTFNTIIKGEQGDAEANLVRWLEREYDALKGKLEALAGKTEYGIQVFWDTACISKQVAEASPAIRELEAAIRSQPRGLAYMYRQQLERLLKQELETRAATEFKALYSRLSRCVDNIQVEKTKQGDPGQQMVVNLSCLVSGESYPALRAKLDHLNNREGYVVRLVGPLPAYSFC